MQDPSRAQASPPSDDPWALAEPIPATMTEAVRAVEAAPGDTEVWSALEELADSEQRPDVVEAVYGKQLEAMSDPAEVEALGQRALRFHDEWSDDSRALERILRAVLRGEGLKAASWKEMFRPQIRLRSKTQFPTFSKETTDANDDIELSYGLGWGLLKTPYGWGAFKEGHGDGFEHYTIIFPERGMGVMVLSNSANGESIFKYLLEATIADTYTPWEWEGYTPYDREPDFVSGNP